MEALGHVIKRVCYFIVTIVTNRRPLRGTVCGAHKQKPEN